MHIILRNFRTTLRRFKVASALNIVGLSVAFAAFILILMQVRYEFAFDRFHPEAERIYRVEISADGVNLPVVPLPFAETFGPMVPGVAAYTLMQPAYSDSYIVVERNGSEVGFMEPVFQADTGFTQVFRPEIVEGSADVLRESGKVLVPASLARKFFGRESGVLGERLSIGFEADTRDYEVGGVYRDFPSNSQLDNVVYMPLSIPEWAHNSWGSCNYFFYVRLQAGVSPETLLREWNRIALAEKIEWIETSGAIGMTALPEIYYDTRPFMGESLTKHGKRTTTDLLLAIAVLVIGIAAVNFVNFATSLTPLRIKNINTRKVLGSSVAGLRAELIAESVGIALLSFGLGLLWVYGLSQTAFNDLISGGISFSVYGGVIWLAAGVALAVGLLSGLYPAFYTTSFPPALVLKKGSFGMSPSGRKLRTLLIGFQFVVSIGLIVAALFLQLQNRYLRRFDTGMDHEQVAVVALNNELAKSEARETVANELKTSAQIEDVAFAYTKIGLTDEYMGWTRSLSDGRDMRYSCCPVSWNFLRVMGIPVVEGRDFTEEDAHKEGTQIFNQAAMRQYGLTIEDRVNDEPIAGVVRDFNFASLRNSIAPLSLYEYGANPWTPLRYAYIKIVGDPYAAVDHIKRTIAKFDPLLPVEVEFFDTAFDTLYQKERKTTALILVFSLLAVVISLVGVFGLVVFETQYRRKEIGVRKVMGATVSEILGMFNRQFVWLVGICFVVAAPLAWYGVREWLATFAYRTPIYWWVFLVSLLIVLFITLLTVTIQSWRAATANPVDALKAE